MSDNTVDLVLEYPQWAAARLAYLEEHVVRLERERDEAREQAEVLLQWQIDVQKELDEYRRQQQVREDFEAGCG